MKPPMIRLNFLSSPVSAKLKWQIPAIGVLSLLFVVQVIGGVRSWASRSRDDAEAEQLRGKLTALEQRLEQSKSPGEDLRKLAGILVDRNEWVRGRFRSPVAILAKLDQGKQPGIHLLSFDAKINGGSLKLAAGDMDGASRYLKEIFHSNVDRLALESKTPEGLLLGYVWND